ncbi:MAG: hypothetical protein FJZ87_14725 [Chloroflexi bacterium]|nr:hypothetical protein [Chloroflexota bacterium]
MTRVIGPDVSFYQDDPETPQGIDFVKMRASAGFVIIRAGQNLWPDPDFKYNWREAKSAGLPRGSYWFYDSRAEPGTQAGLWASMLEGDSGELPLFADFEEKYKGPYSGWKHWHDFLEALKKLIPGKEIGIYTAYYYWRDNAPNSNTQAKNLDYFHQYPLWIANYGALAPRVPLPWTKEEWIFWQYTETGDGKLYGVESNGIDLNYFNGDDAALKERFKVTEPPPPEPEPEPPDDGTGTDRKRHRVTATALRVREGPGTNYAAIGMLYKGDIVEELEATNDRTWIKILTSKGLIGWSSATYLVPVSVEPPPVIPPPDEETDGRNWYRVNTSALTVRETPSANGNPLGYLIMDDTLPAVDDVTLPDWVKIERLDGLSGWCSKTYLKELGRSRPASLRQSLFKGISYMREERTAPRRNVVHTLLFDLHTPGFEFLVTPTRDSNGILCTRTTSKFVDEFNVHAAINGDGFNYVSGIERARKCPNGGDPVKANGMAASRGNFYSRVRTWQPTIFISRENQFTFNKPSKVFNAISGDRILVVNGQIPNNLATNIPNPRTAIGLTKDNRWLLFIVVDGRQPGYSEGLTLPELAEFMVSQGVYSGVNMDGGGSSTMIIRGVDRASRVLNSPIDQNLPGKQRAVANHLGIYIRS